MENLFWCWCLCKYPFSLSLIHLKKKKNKRLRCWHYLLCPAVTEQYIAYTSEQCLCSPQKCKLLHWKLPQGFCLVGLTFFLNNRTNNNSGGQRAPNRHRKGRGRTEPIYCKCLYALFGYVINIRFYKKTVHPKPKLSGDLNGNHVASCACSDISMQHIKVYIIKNPPFPSSPSFDQWLLISPALHAGAHREKSFTSVFFFYLIWSPNDPWNLKCGTQENRLPPHQHCVEWIMRTFLSWGELCGVMNIAVSSGGWNQRIEPLPVKAKKVDIKPSNCIHHLNKGNHKQLPVKYYNKSGAFRWGIIWITLGQFNSAIKRSLEPTFLLHLKRLILFHSLPGIWAVCLRCFYGNRYSTGQGDVGVITARVKRLRLILMAHIPSSPVWATLETEICSLCSSSVGCDSPQPFSQKQFHSSPLKPLESHRNNLHLFMANYSLF